MFKNTCFIITAGALTMTLTACQQPPACPDSLATNNAQSAKSAGCFSLNSHHQLLLIEGFNGKVSIPGGSGSPNESAQCTAHRETWEETGLEVIPNRLIRVMDNGFHLFECEAIYPDAKIDPPFRLEVRHAFWLSAEHFDDFEWRFPEQKHMLSQWIHTHTNNAKDTTP